MLYTLSKAVVCELTDGSWAAVLELDPLAIDFLERWGAERGVLVSSWSEQRGCGCAGEGSAKRHGSLETIALMGNRDLTSVKSLIEALPECGVVRVDLYGTGVAEEDLKQVWARKTEYISEARLACHRRRWGLGLAFWVWRLRRRRHAAWTLQRDILQQISTWS